jgi:hypothetical protein
LATVDELKKMVARRVKVTFSEDVIGLQPTASDSHQIIDTQPRSWTVLVQGELGSLVGTLNGLPIKDLEVEEPHLEEVLMRYYRGGQS